MLPGVTLRPCLPIVAGAAIAERAHLFATTASQLQPCPQDLSKPHLALFCCLQLWVELGEGLKTLLRQLLCLVAQQLQPVVAESFFSHSACSCSRSCLRVHRPTSGASSRTSSCASRAARARSMLLATPQPSSRCGLLTAQDLRAPVRPSQRRGAVGAAAGALCCCSVCCGPFPRPSVDAQAGPGSLQRVRRPGRDLWVLCGAWAGSTPLPLGAKASSCSSGPPHWSAASMSASTRYASLPPCQAVFRYSFKQS